MNYPIHRRERIRSARTLWLEQYKRNADDAHLGWDSTRTFGDVRAALSALDVETCSQAEMHKVIGTGGWAKNECSECGTDCAVLMHIGDEPDYEARYVELCAGCLANLAVVIAGVEELP